MSDDSRGASSDRTNVLVSDAILQPREGKSGVRRTLQRWRLRLLVDADRRSVVALLAGTVFVATVLVGLFGPVSVQEFLTGGTSIGDAYIEIQTGIITAMTIVLAINQLILSPDLGPVSLQRKRLTDAIGLRSEVEDVADEPTTPTEPSAFMRTVVDGIHREIDELEEAVADDTDAPFYDDVRSNIDEARADTSRVNEALEKTTFGRIGFVGAVMHYDASRDIETVRRIDNEYADSLSNAQQVALHNVLDALQRYTTAREYFRTVYIRSEFARFSRLVLYTAIPALVVAHFTIGIVGEDVLVATTFGVRDLLWLESAAFTVSILPVFVVVSYVARLVTISETSIFVSPFTPEKTSE